MYEVLLETIKFVKTPVVVSDNWLALMACRLLESLMMDQEMKYCRPCEADCKPDENGNKPIPQTTADRELMIHQLFWFTMTWTVGACTDVDGRNFINECMKAVLDKKKEHFKKHNFVASFESYELTGGAAMPVGVTSHINLA